MFATATWPPIQRLGDSAALRALLRCPCCRGGLDDDMGALRCPPCSITYPIADDTPILFDPARITYGITTAVAGRFTAWSFRDSRVPEVGKRRPVPTKDRALAQEYRRIADALRQRHATPRLLVVGVATDGAGLGALAGIGVKVVTTDVVLGPFASVVADPHALPLADGAFDAAIFRHGREHVGDAARIATELERVVRPDGAVHRGVL